MATAILHPHARKPQTGLFEAVQLLPFVQELKHPVRRLDFWAVPSFDEAEFDEQFGVKCANAAIEHIRRFRDILFLQNVVGAMVLKGRLTAAEIAFNEVICQTFTEIV